MAWYRANTCSLTSGNPTVTGAGTAWVANAQAGDAFKGPDDKLYEVQSVNSDTSITLASNYTGSPGSGQAYAIIPTQGRVRDLAAQVVALITSYSAVLTGAGVGLFLDGTVATPGISFASDPDCGWYRIGANNLGLATGGVLRLNADAGGLVAVGGAPNAGLFPGAVAGLQALSTSIPAGIAAYQADGTKNLRIGMFADAANGFVGWDMSYSTGMLGYAWKVINVVKMLLDTNGNLGIGGAPTNRLDVFHAVTGIGARVRNTGTGVELAIRTDATTAGLDAGNASSGMNFSINAVEKVRIDGSGNFGVGVAAPVSRANIQTAATAGFPIALTLNNPYAYGVGQGAAGVGIRFSHTSADGGSTGVSADIIGGSEGEASSTAGFLAFKTRTGASEVTTERARIDSAGNLIQTTPTAPPTLTMANQLVLNLTSSTNLRISGRGSDGTTRVVNLTLA